jgi:hypothetical protein
MCVFQAGMVTFVLLKTGVFEPAGFIPGVGLLPGIGRYSGVSSGGLIYPVIFAFAAIAFRAAYWR